MTTSLSSQSAFALIKSFLIAPTEVILRPSTTSASMSTCGPWQIAATGFPALKNAFTKGKGSVGTPGCVSFMFDKKGQIIVDKEEYEGDADELMMIALDAGAEDLVEEEDSFEVLTDPDDFSDVRQALEEAGIPMVNAEVTMIPQTYVTLTSADDIKNITKTLDMLDDDDDVQNVYHNWDE